MNCTGKHGSQAECEIVGELRSLLQVAFTAIRTQHAPPANWAARSAIALGLRTTSDPPYQMDAPEAPFREALARIAAGFYTEKGAENHAKDILRLVDSQSAAATLTALEQVKP